MRFAYPLLIVLLVILIGTSWISTVMFADPKDEAIAFLKDVQSGGLARSVRHFGGNACRCPAKGGWGSYLVYISGQEPNLAFLTGHQFSLGQPKATPIANKLTTMLPWEKPEDFAVDIPITFDPKVYSPLFLPLSTAYGQPISESTLQKFLSDPDKDAWKGFTLRFRPGLQTGAIAPPSEPLPPEAANEFEALKKDRPGDTEKEREHASHTGQMSTEDAVRQALGAEALLYLVPKDAGPIMLPDGSKMPIAQVESQLPRLKSAIMRLHVVRRGQLKDWTIYHFGLMEPVLTLADGKDFKLTHDHRPN
jgi:hypothetical protein